MLTLRNPLFLLSCLLFCINQLLELNAIYLLPLHAYLDDLLCMPIVLTLALAAERIYFKNPAFVLPVSYIAGAVAIFSLVFEVLLPVASEQYTADGLDVLLYLAGALAFQVAINKPLPSY